MEESMTPDAAAKKVLVHLYNSAVVGSLSSISLILRMKPAGQPMNPRHKDLKEIYDSLGSEHRRLFFNAVTAIAEFSVYRTLDFVEQYNRFDAEANTSEFPRLELVYTDITEGKVRQLPISNFGSEELGKEWKETARRPDIRQLVESVINNLLG
jgi:hypothetical protein